MSKGDLKAQLDQKTKKPHYLTVTCYQIAVLLPYNKADTYSWEELAQTTGMEKPVLEGVIGTLIKAKLIVVSGT